MIFQAYKMLWLPSKGQDQEVDSTKKFELMALMSISFEMGRPK